MPDGPRYVFGLIGMYPTSLSHPVSLPHFPSSEEAKKTFDPETLETANVAPRVMIDQAIKISQIGAPSRKQEEELPDPFAEEAARMTPDDVTAVRERLVRKLRRMRERDMPDRIVEAGRSTRSTTRWCRRGG